MKTTFLMTPLSRRRKNQEYREKKQEARSNGREARDENQEARNKREGMRFRKDLTPNSSPTERGDASRHAVSEKGVF